jgi:hypothetical protein
MVVISSGLVEEIVNVVTSTKYPTSPICTDVFNGVGKVNVSIGML